MPSEKQLRANRENAKRSSGPKTAVGRLKSGRCLAPWSFASSDGRSGGGHEGR